ncbi:hypothetical protein NCH01_17660 [Neoasaia chiangmaiensis]|uniref:Uncharacterized protein n=2 Tax=Neoasaia chiangmaiensis TaxID=320497 RepID=A0A1U9KRR2_9PROT|nr:hypothetical protein A0U93_11810 [Neoasaia chiangmaiensis]GEN15335.1 hypothetical protein NCH01_17660 [Neoasaia chiangmaiensis]
MLAANVAGQLVRAGARQVIALDLDPQNTLRLHFGVPLGQRDGMMLRLEQPAEWRNVVVNSRSGVLMMPYGAASFDTVLQHNAKLAAHPELLTQPLRQLAADPSTTVIVDTVPGPSSSLAAVLPATDMLISVLAADAASLALLADVRSAACYGSTTASALDGQRIQHRVVINQFDPLSRLSTSLMKGVSGVLSQDLLGMVFRDEHVAEALVAQQLVSDYAPYSRAAADLSAATQRIVSSLKVAR